MKRDVDSVASLIAFDRETLDADWDRGGAQTRVEGYWREEEEEEDPSHCDPLSWPKGHEESWPGMGEWLARLQAIQQRCAVAYKKRPAFNKQLFEQAQKDYDAETTKMRSDLEKELEAELNKALPKMRERYLAALTAEGLPPAMASESMIARLMTSGTTPEIEERRRAFENTRLMGRIGAGFVAGMMNTERRARREQFEAWPDGTLRMPSEVHYRGFSSCRLCDKQDNGTYEHTLAEWTDSEKRPTIAWPEGYEHYIEAHNVVPSREFYELVLRLTVAPKEKEEEEEKAKPSGGPPPPKRPKL